jgi:hypothetical protein
MFKRRKSSLQAQSIDVVETVRQEDRVFIEEKEKIIEQLFEKTDTYIKTNVDLLKLKAVGKTATLVSSLTANLTLFSLCFLLILMISTGAAIWVGQDIDNMPLGFMIVAGFYTLLITLYFLLGKKMIKKSVRESVISDLIK